MVEGTAKKCDLRQLKYNITYKNNINTHFIVKKRILSIKYFFNKKINSIFEMKCDLMNE